MYRDGCYSIRDLVLKRAKKLADYIASLGTSRFGLKPIRFIVNLNFYATIKITFYRKSHKVCTQVVDRSFPKVRIIFASLIGRNLCATNRETFFSSEIKFLAYYIFISRKNVETKEKKIEFGQVEFYRSSFGYCFFTGDCFRWRRELCNDGGQRLNDETSSGPVGFIVSY